VSVIYRWTAIFAAVLVGGGCGFDVEGDKAFQPPAVYRAWWAKTEACSGLTGDFDRVRWETVPGTSFTCSGNQCVGHWQSDHRIWIAEGRLEDEMVVRHEMLHDLIGRAGHPDPPFGKGCPLTWDTWKGTDD
jgi:hypothetical protein